MEDKKIVTCISDTYLNKTIIFLINHISTIEIVSNRRAAVSLALGIFSGEKSSLGIYVTISRGSLDVVAIYAEENLGHVYVTIS